MADIIFYTNPQSRGQMAHWMLEELGEPYETRWLNYGEEMKGDAFLAVNPMGKVPAIQHRGAVVTEAAAICTYLAASFPEKGLIPTAGDPHLADFHRWMFFAAGPVEQVAVASSMGWEVSAERSQMLGFGSVDATLKAVEIALEPGPYVCADQFTAVDVYLGSHLMWGMQFGTIEKRPVFEAYVARLTDRPAVRRSQQLNNERMATQP